MLIRILYFFQNRGINIIIGRCYIEKTSVFTDRLIKTDPEKK